MTIRKRSSVLFICLLVLASIACVHRVDGSKVTPWEKVMLTNQSVAEANNVVAKSVINCNKAGLLEDATTRSVLSDQAQIVVLHKQLTSILNQGQTAATGQADQINKLISQIAEVANTMTATGRLGVTDPNTQLTIQASVTAISALTQTFIYNLKIAGVLK